MKTLNADHLVMINEYRLPISKKYAKAVRERHFQFTKWRLGI